MLEPNERSTVKRLDRYHERMTAILKPIIFPYEHLFNFPAIHLCLGLIFEEMKLGTNVKDIFVASSDTPNDVQSISVSKGIAKVQLIFSGLEIEFIYNNILQIEDIYSTVNELTKNEIDFFKKNKQNPNQQLYLLEFFTKIIDGRGSGIISTKGLDQFIDQLVLNDRSNSNTLFPYLQNAFLPIKFALLNPNAKVTAFEINNTKYAFAELLKFFYNLEALMLVNASWLHSSLEKAGEIERYDNIINIAPLGLRLNPAVPDPENYPPEFNKSSKTAEVYEQHKLLRHLKENGDGYLLTGRSFAFAARNVFKFARHKLLTDKSIKTIFKLPGGLLSSTMIETVLFHLTKKPNSKVQFVDTNECFQKISRSELGFLQSGYDGIFDAISGRTQLENRVKQVGTEDLIDNDYEIDPNRYVDNSEAAQTRRRLLANYSDYEEVSLGSESITKSIKRYSMVSDFKAESSFILPKVPTKNLKPTSQLKDIKPNHYVIELNTTKLLPGYLLHFLKSELGQLTLDLAARSAYIPTLSTKDVMDLKIPLPSLEVQKNIDNAFNKLEAVNLGISGITEDLSNRPAEVETLISKLNDILDALNELTESEKAFSKILQGEGQLVEFKETFSLDTKRFKYDKDYNLIKEDKIEHSSLKTIAAFMNADGGDLFIGVNDDAVVTGVDEEIDQFYKGSLDKYLLHFNNRIQDRFETPINNMLSVQPIKISEKMIINVQVLPSRNDPIFLKPNSEFYVRSTPATEQLSGTAMLTFIKQRFS